MLDVGYSGGTPRYLAYCDDQSLVRGLAVEMEIPVPNVFTISPESATFIALPIEFPAIVKPNFGDSSVGLTADNACYNVAQLEGAVSRVRAISGYDRPVVVEQFLTGKDISVGIIGNPPDHYMMLPIIEGDYPGLPGALPKIRGDEAKQDTGSVYFTQIKSIPADLPQATVEFLGASCIRLFQRTGCQDYARFDWRLDQNGTPRLLEANPNPGWCWDRHPARIPALAGMSYSEMLQEIPSASSERIFGTARNHKRQRDGSSIAA